MFLAGCNQIVRSLCDLSSKNPLLSTPLVSIPEVAHSWYSAFTTHMSDSGCVSQSVNVDLESVLKTCKDACFWVVLDECLHDVEIQIAECNIDSQPSL